MSSEVPPKVAVLSSYHYDRVPPFQRAGHLFEQAKAILVHPHTFNLIDPNVSEDIFVLRDGDNNIPHHLLQLQEMQNMRRRLKGETRGSGFGYVVNEDGAVGPHTAGEIAFLAIHGIPIVTSRKLTSFRRVPAYAHSLLQATVDKVFALDDINQEKLFSLQAELNQSPPKLFEGSDRKTLVKILQSAVLQQRYEGKLHHVLLTSESLVKQGALLRVLKALNPDSYILVDPVKTKVDDIPEQPFQYEGRDGAYGRIAHALLLTEGYPFYKAVASYENFLVALDPDKFDPNGWASPDKWLSVDRASSIRADAIFADVACFVHRVCPSGDSREYYSKPVVVPTDVALETLQMNGDILYAHVLRKRIPTVDLANPHLSLGNYSRGQQLYDVTMAALRSY